MKREHLKRVIINSMQALLIGTIFLLTPFFTAAQQSYLGNQGDLLGTSDSRMAVTIEETDELVMLHVMGVGPVLADAFGLSLIYQPNSLILTDNTLTYNVPDALDPQDMGSAVISMDPSFSSVYTTFRTQVMIHRPINSGPAAGMKSLNTTVGTSSTVVSAALSIPAGEMIPIYTIYFRKQTPGTDLEVSDLGFYFNKFIPRTYSSWTYRGVSVAYDDAGGSDFRHPNPNLFVYRSVSSITTRPASAVGATFVTLNGNARRGDFAPSNSLMVSGVSSATQTGRLDYDTITQIGFIYSTTDVEIITNRLSNKLVIDGTEYDFPTAAEIAAGTFIRNGITYYITLRNNTEASQSQDYFEDITGLTELTEYYAWSVMTYGFETSDTYAAVGEKITFITISGCIPPAEPIAIANQAFCGDATVADLVAFVESGLDLVWYDALGVMLNPTDALVDGATYYAKASDNGCESDEVPVTVTLNEILSAPVASTPQSFCTGSVVSDLFATGIGVVWYDAQTGGNMLSGSDALVNGQIYYAAQTLGACESDTRTAVKAIVLDNLIVEAPSIVSPQSFCNDATLADIATDGSNLIWYDNNNVELPLSTLLVNGRTYYAAKSAGTCESADRTAVLVYTGVSTIDPPVITSPQQFCAGATLQNVSVPNNQIVWYASHSDDTPLALSTILTNNSTYYASLRAGDCESTTRTPVLTIVDQASEAMVDDTQLLCEGNTISDISVTGAGIKWYDSPTGGTELPATTPLVDGQTYYAVQSTGNCESSTRVGVTITITVMPAPTATSPQNFCGVATVADLVAESTTGIKWYDAQTGGNELSPSTALVDGITYYAAGYNGSCESTTRTAVVVNINEIPESPVVNGQIEICSGGSIDLSSVVSGIDGVAKYYDSLTGDNEINSVITNVTADATYYVADNNGFCNSIRVPIIVTVTESPNISIVEAPQLIICQGSSYNLTINTNGRIIRWTNSDPIVASVSLNGVVYGLKEGTTELYCIVESLDNGCLDSARIEVTVNEAPVITNLQSFVYCNGQAVEEFEFEGTPTDGVYFTWRRPTVGHNFGLDAISGTDVIPAFTAINDGIEPLFGIYEVTAVYEGSSSTCYSDPMRFTITVNPTAEVSPVNNMVYCNEATVEPYVFTGNVPNATYRWFRDGGDPIPGLPENGYDILPGFTARAGSDAIIANYKVIAEYRYANETCNGDTVEFSITILPFPVLDLAYRYNICSDETSVDLTYTTSQTSGIQYNMIFSPAALGAGFINQTQYIDLPSDKITVAVPENIASGIYTGTINIVNGNCTNSYQFEIAVGGSFSIVQQPVSATNLCEDNSVVTLSVVANADNLNYQWYHNDAIIEGATSSDYSFEYNSDLEGVYYVVVSNGCMSLSSEKASVSQNFVSIEMKWDNVLYINDPNHIFSGFQWFKDGYPISKDGYAQYYGEESGFNGTYFARCYYPDGTYVETCPREFTSSRSTIISLYPNPVEPGARITLEIQTDELDIEDATLEIFDALGKLVERTVITGTITEIAAPLSQGTYTARIITRNKQVINERFVVGR